MELFQQMAGMGHERVLFCSNPDVGLQAIIAVHSTVLGPGLGGVRMWPYNSMEEALTDVLRLSRGMTYKAAAAGLNLGGGKAVIIGDPKKHKSEALFRCFGRYVESLGGLYITAEDVGTDMEDMELILTETRWVTGVSPAQGGGGDPSPVTAFGVLQGMKAAVRWTFGDASLAGRTIAIQGLGSVGLHLASYLKEEGAKLFGADIDPEVTDRARERARDRDRPRRRDPRRPLRRRRPLRPRRLAQRRHHPRAALPDRRRRRQQPARRGGAPRPGARRARHPLRAGLRDQRRRPDQRLQRADDGYNRERAMRMTRGIYLNMMRVFEISRDEGIAPAAAADRVAEERIRKVNGLRSQHWGRMIRQRRTRS